MRHRLSKLNLLWTVLGILGLLGVILLVLPKLAPHLSSAWKDLSTAFGTAFLIAAILGASVDGWLKRELLRDAYQTLFGYLLPNELKNELAWVSDQKVLLDHLDLRLTLGSPDDAGLLTVHIEVQAEIKNISGESIRWAPGFAVDEWFHPGRPSRLISVCATLNGVTHSDMKVGSDDPFAIGGRLPELCLNPGDRAMFAAEGEEVRRISDAHLMQLAQATPNPRVSVRAPESIKYRVIFGNREQAQVRQIGSHTELLPGTLLPGQSFRFAGGLRMLNQAARTKLRQVSFARMVEWAWSRTRSTLRMRSGRSDHSCLRPANSR